MSDAVLVFGRQPPYQNCLSSIDLLEFLFILFQTFGKLNPEFLKLIGSVLISFKNLIPVANVFMYFLSWHYWSSKTLFLFKKLCHFALNISDLLKGLLIIRVHLIDYLVNILQFVSHFQLFLTHKHLFCFFWKHWVFNTIILCIGTTFYMIWYIFNLCLDIFNALLSNILLILIQSLFGCLINVFDQKLLLCMP